MPDRIVNSHGCRLAAVTVLALGLVGVLIPRPPDPASAASVPIAANRLTLPPGARALGPLPAATPLRLVVGLTLRHADALDAYLRASRGLPRAQRALSPAQFAALFSPTVADQAAVMAYLRSYGLRIVRTYPDRLLLDVAGPAGAVGRAFGTPLLRYRERQGQVHYANAAVPRLPARLAGLVSTVVGLRDDAPPRHVPLPRLRPSSNSSRHGPATRALVPAPANLLTPAQIQAAYDIAPIYAQVFTATNALSATAAATQTSQTVAITGTGQTVAVYELSPYNPADIATYDAAFGLASTAPVSIAVDGGASDAFGGQGSAEAALDLELVQAVAPGAQILVYNGPASPNGTDNQGADDTYARIVADNRAQVLTTSWGQCEPDQLADVPPDLTLLHNLFAQAVAQGMTIVAASGDTGANDCIDGRTNPSVDYPASDPYVIGVGGTVLNIDAGGHVLSETSWIGSGGGPSAIWPRPSWQAALCIPGKPMRLLPDVALDAGKGYAVWAGGDWNPVNGTSAGPPVWAGLLALVNQARGVVSGLEGTPTPGAGTPVPGLGDIHAQLYALGATPAFRDITFGAGNGAATPTAGWDGVTGLGVPDAYALLRALVLGPIPPLPTPVACPSATPTVVPTASAPMTVTPTVTQTATPPAATPTRTPTSHQKTGLVVRAVPGSVYAGGVVTLQLRGAPGARQRVIFELRYPHRKAQRIVRATDAHGATVWRVRVPDLSPLKRALVVRLSATVQVGKHTLVGWASFRVVPAPPTSGGGGHNGAAATHGTATAIAGRVQRHKRDL